MVRIERNILFAVTKSIDLLLKLSKVTSQSNQITMKDEINDFLTNSFSVISSNFCQLIDRQWSITHRPFYLQQTNSVLTIPQKCCVCTNREN